MKQTQQTGQIKDQQSKGCIVLNVLLIKCVNLGKYETKAAFLRFKHWPDVQFITSMALTWPLVSLWNGNVTFNVFIDVYGRKYRPAHFILEHKSDSLDCLVIFIWIYVFRAHKWLSPSIRWEGADERSCDCSDDITLKS